MRDRQRKLVFTVITHAFWATLEGPELVTERTQLKHTHDAASAA
ncbi:hypothetical protein [Streptomyces violaceusniger]